MSQKLLFVGVLDIPWSSNIPMKMEFQKRGYTVTPFNFRTVARNFVSDYNNNSFLYYCLDQFANCARLPFFPSFINKIGYTLNGRKKMNRRLMEVVRRGNFDLVFFAKADIINYSLIPEINRYTNTWYFFMDSPDIALKVNACKYANNVSWSSATWSSVCRKFKKAGANCFFITQGVDKQIFYPKPIKKKYNVTFVGSKTWSRKRFINALAKQGISVDCFGKGFPAGPIYSYDLAQIYRESKIILNLNHRPGGGFSLRVFQAMGTGSMLLSEYCQDLEAIFKRHQHLDWFNDSDECVKLIRHYLDDEQERERISKNGSEYVHTNYSWEKVIDKILCIINNSTISTIPTQKK